MVPFPASGSGSDRWLVSLGDVLCVSTGLPCLDNMYPLLSRVSNNQGHLKCWYHVNLGAYKSPEILRQIGETRLWYLGGVASAGTSRGFPWPLLGDAVDIKASSSGRVQVLLPQLQDLNGLLTRSGAWRLRLTLRLMLLLLRLGVERGFLPGELGQIRLRRDLLKWMEGQMRHVDTSINEPLKQLNGKGATSEWH